MSQEKTTPEKSEQAEVAPRSPGRLALLRQEIVETIKLRTIDKWQLLRKQGSEQRLIDLKQEEIDQYKKDEQGFAVMSKAVNEEKEKELGLLKHKMDLYTDPDLKAVLEASRKKKESAFDEKLAEYAGKTQFALKMQGKGKEAVDRFHKNISQVENQFAEKIDAKIGKIREKYGYGPKLEEKKNIEGKLNQLKDSIREIRDKVGQYSDALETLESLGDKESFKEIKEKMKMIKEKLKNSEKDYELQLKASAKLDRQIARIDAKTNKWQDRKNGLIKAKSIPEERSVESSSSVVSSPESSSPASETSPVSSSPESTEYDEPMPVVGDFGGSEAVVSDREKSKTLEKMEDRLKLFLEKKQPSDSAEVEKEILDPTIEDLEKWGADRNNSPLHNLYLDLKELKKLKAGSLNRLSESVYKKALELIKKEKGEKKEEGELVEAVA